MILLLAAAMGGFAAGFLAAALADGMARGGQERHFWIVAEDAERDYAHSRPGDRMTGEPVDEDHDVFLGDGDGVIGGSDTKTVYREYSKDFKIRLDPKDHPGIPGAKVMAEVGDTIVIHFRNDTKHNASFLPLGAFYGKGSEGASNVDGTSSAQG